LQEKLLDAFKHPAIKQLIITVAFEGSTSVSQVGAAAFNPMPFATIALATVVVSEICNSTGCHQPLSPRPQLWNVLEEYKETGRRTIIQLSASVYKTRYELIETELGNLRIKKRAACNALQQSLWEAARYVFY
jgi:Domain of unknown function (DUF6532)